MARRRNERPLRSRVMGSGRPRKRFGQHFLAPGWARQVVAAIDPSPGDVFLEIGPGRGALTLPLADSGAPILAVEIDRDLVADLAKHVPGNVTVLSGDILRVDVVAFLSGLEPQQPAITARKAPPLLPRTPSPPAGGGDPPAQLVPAGLKPARRFRVVGNLPYNISAPILFRLLEFHRRLGFFSDATVMLQREVADRLLARPGTKDYGVLTVLTAAHASVSRLLELPPGAFIPAPKVRSTVVRVTFGGALRLSDEALFDRIVRTMFQQRRKTLANALKPLHARAAEIVAGAGLDGRRRPETLQVTEIARLAEQFASASRPPVL
ncbi:MAG TPA: rRNA adenine dimethyltransferase family protein [Vicinamibacterales bacterium]|nr:rRNA adenine dimethyltransferase family protein [Vicinamibacterales bacterium]